MSRLLSRRTAVLGLAALGILPLSGWTKSRQLPFGSDRAQMVPGDYTWDPDRSPDGAVVGLVSIPEQRVFFYRAGVLFAVSTCSTGRKGHRTPTGVFTILQKDKDHVSSTYKGAKMPYMERLTWSGIALHAGNLPGYPASHGCIRLPLEFAAKLFGVTRLGAVIIIADSHSDPQNVVHPGPFLPAKAEAEAFAHTKTVHARKSPPRRRHQAAHRPAKAVISVADKTLTIFEDGHVRATGPIAVKNPAMPVGSHVFVLKAAQGSQSRLVWNAYAYGETGHANDSPAVINRLTTDDTTASAMRALMHPGFVLVITDAAASRATRSGRDFVIATHHEPEGWQTEVFSER